MLKLVTGGRGATTQPIDSGTFPKARDMGKPVAGSGYDGTARPNLDRQVSRGNTLLTAGSGRGSMYKDLSPTDKEKLLAAIENCRDSTVAAFGERAYEHAVKVLLEAYEFTSSS